MPPPGRYGKTNQAPSPLLAAGCVSRMLAVRKPSLPVSKRVFFITVGAVGVGAAGDGLGVGCSVGGVGVGACVGVAGPKGSELGCGACSKRSPALGEKQPAQRWRQSVGALAQFASSKAGSIQ